MNNISLIVCMDNNNGIGKDGVMPWHLPKDLKHFKETTRGGLVVFGRSTWEGLPTKPLPERKNAVLTGDLRFRVPQVWTLHHIEDIVWLGRHDERYSEVFICGGQKVYEQMLPYADRLYITRVNAGFLCDTFFPQIDYSKWVPVEGSIRKEIDNGYELFFVTYDKKEEKHEQS